MLLSGFIYFRTFNGFLNSIMHYLIDSMFPLEFSLNSWIEFGGYTLTLLKRTFINFRVGELMTCFNY